MLCRQNLSAPQASALQHFPAVLRTHAFTEAVFGLALPVLWLERHLCHFNTPRFLYL
jgi:hypothetical protein